MAGLRCRPSFLCFAVLRRVSLCAGQLAELVAVLVDELFSDRRSIYLSQEAQSHYRLVKMVAGNHITQ